MTEHKALWPGDIPQLTDTALATYHALARWISEGFKDEAVDMRLYWTDPVYKAIVYEMRARRTRESRSCRWMIPWGSRHPIRGNR